jgi:hypothetical protein
LQLRDRPRARQLDTLLTQCEAQTLLQMLALHMMQQRQERILHADLRQVLIQGLQQQEETISPDDFLDQVVQISELLVQQEDEYEFAHLSFQEYLAAAEVARNKQEILLYDHFDDNWWEPTILLYAEQLKNKQKILLARQALENNAIDLANKINSLIQPVDRKNVSSMTSLSLACPQCGVHAIVEYKPSVYHCLKCDFEKDLSQALYSKLEQYLQNGRWRKADQETYRLMITAVGKEEGQWFDPEELLNFPCEDLKAIDGLWVTHSQGKFGFSVQKQIYVACGAKLDGKSPDDKIWDEFCDRVGWRKAGKYLSYQDLQASPSLSPVGEFPIGGIRRWRGVVGRGRSSLFVSSLAQRLVNCSTGQF